MAETEHKNDAFLRDDLYWEWLAPNKECILGEEKPPPNKRWALINKVA